MARSNPNSTSFFPNNGNILKMYKSSFILSNGKEILTDMCLSDLGIKYEIHQKLKVMIPAMALDFSIFECLYNINATFLLIKVIGDCGNILWKFNKCGYDKDGEECNPYKNIGQILLLTGNQDHYIDDVLIWNNSKNCAHIEILIAGYDSACPITDFDLPFFATINDISDIEEIESPTIINDDLIIGLISDSNDNTMKQTFDLPDTYDIDRIEQYDINNNIWFDIDVTDFDATPIQHTINGIDVDYIRYEYNGFKLGNRIIKIIFK